MINLPRCKYPSAADISNHGFQPLPETLPHIDLHGAQKYRSNRVKPVIINSFTSKQILELSRIIANSFAAKEPMNRHLQPPVNIPKSLIQSKHTDPLGSHSFGPWTKENMFYWFIRLMVLSDPTSPSGDIRVNKELLNLSLAILNANGQIIGGAYNVPLSHEDDSPPLRDDPFLHAIQPFIQPPLSLILAQEHSALEALYRRYPAFEKAHRHGKVGCHFLVARSDSLPVVDTFELVAASAERFLDLNYQFLVISATNEWTGAACEALRGVRVHYAPYRTEKRVAESENAKANEVHSPDGFLSDKDSGSMFYLIKLR